MWPGNAGSDQLLLFEMGDYCSWWMWTWLSEWIDSPSNGLDSEWQKPLDDAIAQPPRALCQRNGVWPLTQHVSQTQDSREPSPKYPATNTAPAAHPRSGSQRLAKQSSLRSTLARLISFVEKTIQLLCKACRAAKRHVWYTSTFSLELHKTTLFSSVSWSFILLFVI